jgi:hypothetical protein
MYRRSPRRDTGHTLGPYNITHDYPGFPLIWFRERTMEYQEETKCLYRLSVILMASFPYVSIPLPSGR